MDVTGSGFVTGGQVFFGATALATSVASATSAQATVPASLVTAAGTVQVTFVNPTPGGGASGSLTFMIAAPDAGSDAGSDADADASTGVTCTTVQTMPNCSQTTTVETNVGFSLMTYAGDPQAGMTSTSLGLYNLYNCSGAGPCLEFTSGPSHTAYTSPLTSTVGVTRSGNTLNVNFFGARGSSGCVGGPPLSNEKWQVTCTGTTTLP
jgi:hypothetical protein